MSGRVVIVGGGIVGASSAYFFARGGVGSHTYRSREIWRGVLACELRADLSESYSAAG